MPFTGHTLTDNAMTHHTDHIEDHLHITALHIIDPEIMVGHTHDHPIDP